MAEQLVPNGTVVYQPEGRFYGIVEGWEWGVLYPEGWYRIRCIVADSDGISGKVYPYRMGSATGWEVSDKYEVNEAGEIVVEVDSLGI